MNRKLSALARRALDERTRSLDVTSLAPPPAGGWMRATREALGMSATQFAERLGVARQTAQQQERNELDGSIRLSTLRRAAEALDCQFVYAFVPRTSLEDAVLIQARKVADAELARVDQTMLLEGQRVERSRTKERMEERVNELIGSRKIWNEAKKAET